MMFPKGNLPGGFECKYWVRHGHQEKSQIVIKIDRGGYCNLSNTSLSLASWVPENDNQIPFWGEQSPNAELCHGEADSPL